MLQNGVLQGSILGPILFLYLYTEMGQYMSNVDNSFFVSETQEGTIIVQYYWYKSLSLSLSLGPFLIA